MAWQDNYSELYDQKFSIEDGKEWKMSIEEHKSKGTMQINIREFKISNVEGGYNGPTKNGIIFKINSEDDLNKFQEELSKVFNKVKEVL